MLWLRPLRIKTVCIMDLIPDPAKVTVKKPVRSSFLSLFHVPGTTQSAYHAAFS